MPACMPVYMSIQQNPAVYIYYIYTHICYRYIDTVPEVLVLMAPDCADLVERPSLKKNVVSMLP